jgi:hypothetical protein
VLNFNIASTFGLVLILDQIEKLGSYANIVVANIPERIPYFSRGMTEFAVLL